MSSWTHERAVLARATQRGDAKRAAEARERMKVARIEEHIRALVADAPELPNEVRDRLALLLRPTA